MNNLSVELKRLLQERLSGTLFISGENRRIAQIGLLDGNIVALSCLNKRGLEALSLIRQINPSWSQFIKGTSIAPDSILPSTADILNSLDSGVASASSGSPGTTKNLMPEIISQKTHEILIETLAEFMGPVAPMICNKVLQQVRSLNSAIDLLAQEIPDRQLALEFKNRVRQKI